VRAKIHVPTEQFQGIAQVVKFFQQAMGGGQL